MPAATTNQPAALSSAQYQSLCGALESSVINHAALTEAPGDDADNALRLVGASSAGLQICETLQKKAVHNARLAGRSWSELGALIGITRQAAQQRFTTSTPKEWFVTEWIAPFEGHKITVRNSWNGGIRLLLDGQQVAENRKMFTLDKERPALSATVAREKGGSFLIEVFAHALFSVRVKIAVDGKQIGGEIL